MTAERIATASPLDEQAAKELSARVFRLFRHYTDAACFGAITMLLVWAAYESHPSNPRAALEAYIDSLRKSFEAMPAPKGRGPLQ